MPQASVDVASTTHTSTKSIKRVCGPLPKTNKRAHNWAAMVCNFHIISLTLLNNSGHSDTRPRNQFRLPKYTAAVRCESKQSYNLRSASVHWVSEHAHLYGGAESDVDNDRVPSTCRPLRRSQVSTEKGKNASHTRNFHFTPKFNLKRAGKMIGKKLLPISQIITFLCGHKMRFGSRVSHL